MVALILRAISVSSRSRLTIFPFSTFFLKWLIDSIILGGRRCMASGMFAKCLTTLRTNAEAACIRGEFFPVTIVPFPNSMAAPQYMPSFPLPFFSASIAACLAGCTTIRSLGVASRSSSKSSTLWTVSLSTNPMAYSQAYLKYRRIISWIAAFLTVSSSMIPNPARLTPMSVGDL